MGVIPKPTIEQGKWYQPYIHSVPENFTRARDAYYSGWNLEPAIAKAKSKAIGIFDRLESYYLQQEESLADFLGIKHSTLIRNMGSFLNNITEMWTKQTKSGGKFGFMTDMPQMIREIEQTEKEINSPPFIQKVVNTMMKDNLKRYGKSGAKIKGSRKRAAEKIVTEFLGFTQELLRNEGVENPNQIAETLIENIMLGKSITKGLKTKADKTLNTFIKEYGPYLKLIKELRSEMVPVSLKGNMKTTSISSRIGAKFGFFNEALYSDIINQVMGEGSDITANALSRSLNYRDRKTKVSAEMVGTKATKKQVQDVEVTFTNKQGEQFKIGLDLKFSTYGAGEYKRGPNVKYVDEITSLIPKPLSGQMMYLLANSFYHQDDATYNSIVGSSKTGKAELFVLINVVRGLYGLLPASAVDFTTIDQIEKFVKLDNRMYILVNDQIMAMTSFLKTVKEIVLKGERKDESILDLTKNLEIALNKMDAQWELKTKQNQKNTGVLYQEKLRILSLYDRAKSSTSINLAYPTEAYKYLSMFINQNVTRQSLKDEWKFTVSNQSFQFKPGKQ